MPAGAWWTERDPEIFFPQRGKLDDLDKARWTCFSCPVQKQCEAYRERTDSRYGVWAGKLASIDAEKDVLPPELELDDLPDLFS